MPLSKNEVDKLLSMVICVQPDTIDCDECYKHLAEYAELELAGLAVPDALKAIGRHLEQCACCRDELDALIVGIEDLDD
ncbi:MAG: hypothetical protein Aurels2KO_46480 [Aureliella sp.]